ncbi:flavin monoamine oxidase family protein [Limnoglobus roseus]|uniref:Flavin containing amine oxidoreductase n=1 Tax=Limnoglobus roseus TaxID=2598579 RepID=A0A5C1AFN5_9BACT|nr:FAD-dependent oxidoreductase [Limnoglobus roseus]QEL17630.1 flavin containing amine oxidoreductase [Limnoglobus roseus]
MTDNEAEHGVPRRAFLIAAAAAAAGPVAAADPPTREVDVAVVGAGLAGLTAARELRRHKVTVCVIEARDRVGGRTLDHPIGGGHVVEGGGQWAGPTQTAVLGLAKDLGVDTFQTHATGKTVVHAGGARLTVAAGEGGGRDLRRAKDKLDALAREVPLADPWAAKRAKEWDAVTVADWLKANAGAAARDELGLEVETALGPPARTSLLWFLFYVHSAGGLHALNVGAQELRFQGGPQALSKKLAAALGADLVLASPVSKVDHGGGGVVVESKLVRVKAKRAVVAMMPADAGRIAFAPDLPAARAGLVKKWVGEPGFKVNAVYPTPFWRAAGLSGLAVSDRGPAGVTFDNSPPDGSKGVVVVFLDPKKAPKGAAARKKAVVDDLVALFGKGANAPAAYVETDWAGEAWTAGCVSPLPPGVLTAYGAALRAPVGTVHWAGAETSDVWCGYMDGAVRSGVRAADEVRKALS